MVVLDLFCHNIFDDSLRKMKWYTTIFICCRLGTVELSGSGHGTPNMFTCVVCQVDLAPSEGISVHAGSIFSTSSKPWQGPFLCADCRNKKDAMEGKRPSRVRVA